MSIAKLQDSALKTLRESGPRALGRAARSAALRLLLFLVTALGVLLIAQLPFLLLMRPGPEGRPVLQVRPDVYWQGVTGFAGRVMVTPELQEFLREAWWRSGLVLAVGLALAILIGTVIGIASAVTTGGRWRRPLLGGTLLALAIPDFIVVILVQRLVVFLYREFDFRLFPILSGDSPRGWMLPALALAILPAAMIARIAAIVLDDIYRQDYVRTARAKGVPPWRVLYGHALRNGLPRIAASLPQAAAFAVSALLPVEWITNWPGLGFQVMLGTTMGRGALAMSIDKLALASLALIVTYAVLDGLARWTAARLGRRASASEAEGMV